MGTRKKLEWTDDDLQRLLDDEKHDTPLDDSGPHWKNQPVPIYVDWLFLAAAGAVLGYITWLSWRVW